LAHLTQFTDPKWSRIVASNLWLESSLALSLSTDFMLHIRTWEPTPRGGAQGLGDGGGASLGADSNLAIGIYPKATLSPPLSVLK